MLKNFGVGEDCIQSFYHESWACVRGESSERFNVNVGLRQGCVMSPLTSNAYMDSVVRKVNAREQEVVWCW